MLISQLANKQISMDKGVMVSKNFIRFFYIGNIKFIYSEKATKFCKIFTLLLSYVVPVKSKMKISQNFMAFSEYMNFKQFIETVKG